MSRRAHSFLLASAFSLSSAMLMFPLRSTPMGTMRMPAPMGRAIASQHSQHDQGSAASHISGSLALTRTARTSVTHTMLSRCHGRGE